MSLLSHIFHRHQEPAVASATLVNWPGQSGQTYQYEIHPMEEPFRPLPGNYIYAKQAEDGDWIPVYIAQTRDLHQRLEGHVRLGDAAEHGATHIHTHYCNAGQAARCSEERDLIQRWQPECNDRLEG